MGKKLLLKDIARLAGVSEMTASRALRGAPDVSESTRQKVQDCARKAGYVPNRIAGALSSKSVNLVGVVVPSLSSFVFPEVLSGISSALKGSPLKPVIGVTGYDLQEEEEVIREMLSWRPSGLIVAGLEHSEAARTMLQAADCPVVEIMDTDGDPVAHCVGISHLEAGRAMADALAARGYRRIGFIGTKMPQDFRAEKRLRGFLDGLAAHGLELADRELYSGTSSIEAGRRLTAELLERTLDLECIYFSSDVMAIGAYMNCLAAGLRIPEDLAIVGFNNLELLKGLPLELATTEAHRFEIGERAAEIVLAAPKEAGAGDVTIVKFQPSISPGQSL
ncbi:LacI family DNA-binding transcriptional regulator [Thalassovita aquimarina]|uniref:LacI family DNA-binding transcriptional regulator n=1 Tax=Thalassovita aquimarina TaxID=2785917 RepID=A0ABS5HWP4_9RHOB|nr:LacI family DNA-binding transcriptional regulator [Thalassovita aquimarina]MBR9652998.1 LacI family DNA-binding transcriptional regulator [Thalassovita aquimarina]